jgi:Family of unknown function (DUF6228)
MSGGEEMLREIPDLDEVHRRVIFEASGTNRPAQFSLEGPYADGADRSYMVSLVYRHISASWRVSNLDPVAFLAYFEDLAEHRGGWEGVKRVSNGDGDFSLDCEYQGHCYTPEVWLVVRLATDSTDPYWALELRLELSPEALVELAARARSFFGKPV